MNVETLKECPRKNPITVAVSQSFTTSLGTYSGNVKLDYRLDNIVGFKVKHVGFITSSVDNLTNANGTLYALSSSSLAGLLAGGNSFQVARSTDLNDAISIAASNVLAFFTRPQNLSLYQVFTSFFNKHVMKFSAPQNIQYFDWSIAPLQGNLGTQSVTYCVEFIIEFYELCTC